MAYAFHIVRGTRDAEGATPPIPLAEWHGAIKEIDGLSIMEGTVEIGRNPRTGAVLSIEARPGDVALAYADGKRPFIMFGNGYPSVARIDPTDAGSLETRLFFSLAALLRARVEGDEGEEYQAPT